ncbi:MAG: radical SAM family heme chaperone HemW [Hydrogenothermaceae bacterium]
MINGVYIHIPFCSLKCPYCDFTSFISFDENIKRKYVNTLLKEVELYSHFDYSIETIYFGGGTPTTLDPYLLGEVIEFITKRYRVSSNLEITVESNPNNYSLSDFKVLKAYGVNRISFGNQSFLIKNLKTLGRDHTPINTLKSIENVYNAGIENINLDLIYGIPGQSLRDLEKDLQIYTDLPVKHISAYMLTAYEDTPFGMLVNRGEIELPEDDLLYRMFKLIDTFLEDRGFERYELSNWAKSGFSCKHNLFYWTHREFLGVGVSAWSFVDNVRFGNTKNINQYIQMVEKGLKPVVNKEVLDDEKMREEKIFLGLRLKEGVDIELIKNVDLLSVFVSEGYGEINEGKLSLTPKGIMVINYITSKLI